MMHTWSLPYDDDVAYLYTMHIMFDDVDACYTMMHVLWWCIMMHTWCLPYDDDALYTMILSRLDSVATVLMRVMSRRPTILSRLSDEQQIDDNQRLASSLQVESCTWWLDSSTLS